VSGIIAARNKTIDVVGVAPNATLYALKVLRASGSDSQVMAGLDWAAANASVVCAPIRVVNHYSAPTAFIGRRLEVRESYDRVVIYAGPREITAHDREAEPLSRYLFRPEHRPPRGQGWRHDREPFPEEKDLRRLLPDIEAYLDALKRRGKLQTTLAFRQLLRMAREYPREPLLAAIQTAAHYGLYDLGRLERMVLRGIATTYFHLPLSPEPARGDPDDEPTDGRTPAAPQELAPEPDGRHPA